MLWIITLKEDKNFWTNAGGYSADFRAFVQYSYYPLITMDVVVTAVGTIFAVVLLGKHPLSGLFAFAWLPVIWLMLGVTLYLNVSDNIYEWIDRFGDPRSELRATR